ncbi:MAG: hypothetical protein LBH42_02180, partial [Treponema sp.]|nr:hypothetical protein [Treponema sp.]
WSHFCALAKNDIKRKKDLLSTDIAAFQSFFIIDAINGYHRSKALKQRETEMAFKNLESHLGKPPFLYSMDQIIKLTSPKGKVLLSLYTSEELEAWLKKQTTESKNSGLPALLIMKGQFGDESCFILKDKMLPFCNILLTDARMKIKEAILKQWSRLLLEYKKEPSMGNDDEFERALSKLTHKQCPELVTLLADPKLLLVYREMENSQHPPTTRIFYKGALLPYSSLFSIHRKDILQNAKEVLPFWFTMPIISAIIGFIKKLSGKNNKSRPSNDEITVEQEILGESSRTGEIRAAAEELEIILIPPGHTIDSYMEELENRWGRLIDRVARKNLIEDVKYLGRDSLRRTLRLQKRFKPTRESISQMAYNLVIRNQALSLMGARDSLLLYLELYFLKLLENIK